MPLCVFDLKEFFLRALTLISWYGCHPVVHYRHNITTTTSPPTQQGTFGHWTCVQNTTNRHCVWCNNIRWVGCGSTRPQVSARPTNAATDFVHKIRHNRWRGGWRGYQQFKGDWLEHNNSRTHGKSKCCWKQRPTIHKSIDGKTSCPHHNKHAGGRSGESRCLGWNNWYYNPFMNCREGLWAEMKTLSKYTRLFFAFPWLEFIQLQEVELS